MGLERGLDSVKDELQMFIESQKRKLDSEKRELKKAQATYSPRDDQASNVDEDESLSRQGHSKQSQRASEFGDDYGSYERRQKELREEQRREYKRFAAEKEFRRTGKVDPSFVDDTTPRENKRKTWGATDFKRTEVSTPDIIDAYAELLRKKRAEERMYRGVYDDPDVEAERKVRFNESETENLSKDIAVDDEDPFRWAREKAKTGQRQKSAGDSRHEKSSEIDSQTRSKSVPPTTKAGIFGGSESPDASKRRKEQYKKELELQIKEKEEQKMREKLKRMGRISSSDDLVEDKKIEKSPKAKPDVTENERPDSQLRTGSKSQNRSQRRKFYDDNEFDDERFVGRNATRGDMPHRGMAAYDPYSQMMPNRFDMGMNPYLLQNAMFGGGPGFNGGMYGQNMPMFGQHAAMLGPNAGMMPRMGVNGDFRRGTDAEFGGERTARLDSQRSQRTPKSPRKDDSTRQNETALIKSKKSPRGKAALAGVFGDNDAVDKEAERAAKLAYQEELKQQMKEKQAAKEKEKKERERYDAKIEAEIEIYNPWGKSGGGAPVKDQSGRLVADLNTMHRYNETGTIVSPRMQANDATRATTMSDLPKDSPVLAALSEFQNATSFAVPAASNGELDDQAPEVATNQKATGRGAALLELKGETKNPNKTNEQLEYQLFLKQQIEEKQRKKLEEERKQKEEEELERKRLEEQRIKMEQEFLLEQEREKKKEEELRAKNDEMRKIAEQKRHEAERQRKEMEEDRVITIQRRSSELYQPTTETRARPASPPIPALQKKADGRNTSISHQYTEHNSQQISYERPKSRPIPTLAKQQNIEVEHNESRRIQVNGAPSPQAGPSGISHQMKYKSEEIVDDDMRYLTSIRDQLYNEKREAELASSRDADNAASQQRVIKQLAALRKQLSVEEQKVQSELDKNMEKYKESKTIDENLQRNETGKIEIFEKARIRRGSAARKPVPKYHEKKRADPKQVDDFNAITDTSSIMDFKMKYPSKPISASELDLQQKEFIRLQEQKLQALRQAINETSNQLMMNIGNDKQATGKPRPGSKHSLLDSDSKFINVDDPSMQTNSRLSTAQSVRRSLNMDSPIQETPLQKPSTPGGYSMNSMTSQAIDEMAARNEARLRRIKKQTGRDVMSPNTDDLIESYLNDAPTQSSRPNTNQSEKSLRADSRKR